MTYINYFGVDKVVLFQSNLFQPYLSACLAERLQILALRLEHRGIKYMFILPLWVGTIVALSKYNIPHQQPEHIRDLASTNVAVRMI